MASGERSEKRGEDDDSLWMRTAPGPSYPALSGNEEFDVVVVGAGITGLTTAYFLKQSGARVAVIDRHRVASGTTGKTTAKVSALHSLTYAQLTAKHGEDKARRYAEANQDAVERIAALVEELGSDCQFERASAYTYTNSDDQVSQIEAEVEAATRLGLPASYTEDTDLPFPVRAAVRLDGQAHFHPGRYCQALAAAMATGGSRVFEATDGLDVAEDGDGAVVRTPHGDLSAGQVVMATLLPFVDIGGFFAKAEPTRSYALAARVRGSVPRGMYLSVDSPTRSIRPVRYEDADGLVLGGPSHPSGQEDHTLRHYEDLERWAQQTFDVESVDYRWSAQDYSTVHTLPYVGRSPRMARTYVATGFRKWGITNGTAAARIIADAITGRDNAWREAFDATRIGDAETIVKLAKQNLEVGKHFVKDRLARLRASALDDLHPGQGSVVRVGGQAVGAYRGPDGAVHAVSVTCSHMACTLRWNEAEITWDCPCHGSRFSVDGRVIDGPAVEDLAPVPVEAEPEGEDEA